MQRTKYIPSIVSLTGGLIACVVTMINPYETYEIFLIVLAALIVFYIAGSMMRYVFNKIFYPTKLEEDDENAEGEEGEAGEDGENQKEGDGAENSEEKNEDSTEKEQV